MSVPRPHRRQLIWIFLSIVLPIFGAVDFLLAEEEIQVVSAQKTRTIVADVLMVDGDFYIVRGDRGEIQIEVTPDTVLSEEFTFGDRIKAIVLPNDVALTITRAASDEPLGITSQKQAEPSPSTEDNLEIETVPQPVFRHSIKAPGIRVIIADLLMVDENFYIVRSQYGEIQIEITPDTKLEEDFTFGDRIKARVTPTNKALSVVRAGKDEQTGIQDEAAPLTSKTPTALDPLPPTFTQTEEKPSAPVGPETPSTRTIVADVLMVDGDFYIVRGDRGEIQIEVTPHTIISESFDYGDRIKATVLPNDKALTIERADPHDPIGTTTP